MSLPRLPFVVLISVAAGFGLGYLTRPNHAAAPASAPVPAKPPSVVAATIPPATPTFPTDATAPDALVLPTSEHASPQARWHQRHDALRWLREIGAPVRRHLFLGKQIDPALAKLLDLAPGEMTQITQIANEAESAITRLRAAQATSRRSSDGQQLIVEAPPADAAESGAIYDRLQASLRTTLGAERYAILNEIAGESLERSYDRFGLNTVRYELNLQPKMTNTDGTRYYEYTRHFVDATGNDSGNSTSVVPLNQLDPLLAAFIPPEVTSKQAPPAAP